MATNVIKAFKLVSAEGLDASFVSDPVTLQTLDKVAFNISCSSVITNTGTFYVQHRIFYNENSFSDWATLSLSAVPTLANANAVFLVEAEISPGQVRVGFTSGGGGQDGVCDVWVSGSALGGSR